MEQRAKRAFKQGDYPLAIELHKQLPPQEYSDRSIEHRASQRESRAGELRSEINQARQESELLELLTEYVQLKPRDMEHQELLQQVVENVEIEAREHVAEKRKQKLQEVGGMAVDGIMYVIIIGFGIVVGVAILGGYIYYRVNNIMNR